jgi:hypothetical protein
MAVNGRARYFFSRVTWYQNWNFGLFLLFCLASGTICILYSIQLRSTTEEPLRQDLMFRVGHLVTNGPTTNAIGSQAASAQDTALSQQLLQLLQRWPTPSHLSADLIRDLGIALLIAVL